MKRSRKLNTKRGRFLTLSLAAVLTMGMITPALAETDPTVTEINPETQTTSRAPTGEGIVPIPGLSFRDVSATDWFADAVEYTFTKGLMKGTSDTLFMPNEKTSRAMCVTILHRLENEPDAAASGFEDVEDGSRYEPAVNWAREKGVVQGRSDTVFDPHTHITREEWAVMLCNYLDFKGLKTDVFGPLRRDFRDGDDVSSWAEEAMNTMTQTQLYRGDNWNLRPKSSLTRAEMAAILERAHKLYFREEPQSSGFTLKSADTERSFADSMAEQMPADKNWNLSPYSLEMCLAMLANGADGQTKEEILKALQINDLDKYNGETKALLEQYDSFQRVMSLETANSMWINQDRFDGKGSFLKDFREVLSVGYRAEAREVRDADSVEKVNAWTKEKTRGKIDRILTDENRQFATALVNAVYFKAAWQNTFSESLTREQTFHNADGKEVSVPFMRQTEHLPYFSAEGVQAVRLDYSKSYAEGVNGRYDYHPEADFSMYFLLCDGQADVQHILEQAKFEARKVALSVPKFKIEYGGELNENLKSLGIRAAFSKYAADLMKMVDPALLQGDNLYLSSVLQKTYIAIDEEGTEAAAVTAAVEAKNTAVPKPEPVIDFTADRPFYFAIRDNASGRMLFVGQYNKGE